MGESERRERKREMAMKLARRGSEWSRGQRGTRRRRGSDTGTGGDLFVLFYFAFLFKNNTKMNIFRGGVDWGKYKDIF